MMPQLRRAARSRAPLLLPAGPERGLQATAHLHERAQLQPVALAIHLRVVLEFIVVPCIDVNDVGAIVQGEAGCDDVPTV